MTLRQTPSTETLGDSQFARAIAHKVDRQEFDSVRPGKVGDHIRVRLGTSAGATCGFGEREFRRVGELMLMAIDGPAETGPERNRAIEEKVLAEVANLGRLPDLSIVARASA